MEIDVGLGLEHAAYRFGDDLLVIDEQDFDAAIRAQCVRRGRGRDLECAGDSSLICGWCF